MSGIKFHVTATNPRGLDYDMITGEMFEAGSWIARIANRGAVDIRINGEPANPDMVAQFQRIFTVA